MTESLSIQEARKLVLLSQRLPPKKQGGTALSASLLAIEHLGYVQIDTISVIQRAHHHTLWNRNPRYRTSHLNTLLESGKVFEYWTHAASYLPMVDYRFTLPRKEAMARGEQKHWYKKDTGLMAEVLQRIRAEGPLMAKDFEGAARSSGGWSSKPAKRALECLFMQGDLMISGRKKFNKVYDLTERVLPEGIDTTIPEEQESGRHRIERYLRANGLGQEAEICYLQKETKPLIRQLLKEMELAGELVEVRVGESSYYSSPQSLELLGTPLSRSTPKILSPFDNLLIQRKRIRNLFDFDYLLECYLPASKRQFGYFSLPILWDGRLVARMDCKVERKSSIFHVQNLVLESRVNKSDTFIAALVKELSRFMDFNSCSELVVQRSSPPGLAEELQRVFTE